MPIKQVTCSICHERVNRARTYHIGDKKRACKTHDGVLEKKDALEAKKKQEAAAEQERHERRQDFISRGSAWSGDTGLKCWVCMNPGIRQDQFAVKMLVEMEKQKKIHGGFVNIFDPKQAIRIPKRCIFIVPKDKADGAMKYIREDFQGVIGMAGCVAVCGPCCRHCGIDPMPPVDLDKLAKLSFMYSAFLEPVFSDAAGRELARDN